MFSDEKTHIQDGIVHGANIPKLAIQIMVALCQAFIIEISYPRTYVIGRILKTIIIAVFTQFRIFHIHHVCGVWTWILTSNACISRFIVFLKCETNFKNIIFWFPKIVWCMYVFHITQPSDNANTFMFFSSSLGIGLNDKTDP